MSDLIEREPIIDRLNYVIEHGVASKTTGLHPISAEKVKEYIEALPPAEQNNVHDLPKDADLISRQETTEHFKRIIESTDTHGECNEGFNAGLEFCISHISTMPPAEQRKGRWIFKEMGGKDGFRCSECGFFAPWDYEYYPNPNYIKNYKVCPHCIAKMEGE